jgi:hypothetical protein
VSDLRDAVRWRVYGAVYLVLALRSAYDRTAAGALWRAAAVAAVYVIAVGAALMATVLPVVLGRR